MHREKRERSDVKKKREKRKKPQMPQVEWIFMLDKYRSLHWLDVTKFNLLLITYFPTTRSLMRTLLSVSMNYLKK